MLMAIKFGNVVIKMEKSTNHLMVQIMQCDKCNQHTGEEAETPKPEEFKEVVICSNNWTNVNIQAEN